MTFVSLLCVLFLYASCSCIADKPECEKALSLCKIPAIYKPRPKGIKGDQGLPGEKGKRGTTGEPGPPGKPGEEGVKGSQGIAVSGDIGDEGKAGIRGSPGDTGSMGITGLYGLKGSQGDEGIPGAIGPPGSRGIDGACPCGITNPTSPDKYDKLKNFCKDSPVASTKKYTLKLDHYKKLYVSCVLRENATALTCLQTKIKSEPETYSFQNISKGFWLSGRGLTLNKLYGYNRKIISLFQENSNSAFQTIRYHCRNSIPFSRDNVETSLLLLTWNDNTIGPMPTLTKPYFYSIENDGCSNNTKGNWSYTDIQLVSTAPRRVPVIDFFIREIGNEMTQEIKIENIELCFE